MSNEGISAILAAVREFGDQTEEYKVLGNIKVIKQDDLLLFNYTEKATFERRWNGVERVSRGLIVNWRTGEIVARPFSKFFNLGEMPETQISALPTDGYVEVTDKLDGSLLIAFEFNGELRTATRGSFSSEQAQFGHDILSLNDSARTTIITNPGLTFLFEVIYPDNRIVLSYPETMMGVHLLGIVDNEMGYESAYDDLASWASWMHVPVVSVVETSVAALPDLAAQAQGIEGWVVRFGQPIQEWLTGTFRVKIKTAEYLRLHRLYSECNARHILEMMEAAWDSLVPWIKDLPDDLIAIAEPIYTQLAGEYYSRESNAIFAFEATRHLLYDSRKAFAQAVLSDYKEYAPYIFGLADGKDVRKMILREMREWVKTL